MKLCVDMMICNQELVLATPQQRQKDADRDDDRATHGGGSDLGSGSVAHRFQLLLAMLVL